MNDLDYNQLVELLKLRGVHKSLSVLCDADDVSLTKVNDALFGATKVRNNKFKQKLIQSIPLKIVTYLTMVTKRHRNNSCEHLKVVTPGTNNLMFVPYVISDTPHFSTCLASGSYKAHTSNGSPDLISTFSEEELTALFHTAMSVPVSSVSHSNDSLQKLLTPAMVKYVELLHTHRGCNAHYLNAEYNAFKNCNILYVVNGTPFDPRTGEGGFKGRARLTRLKGYYWFLDTVYGDLGACKSAIYNWLHSKGYKLLVNDFSAKPVGKKHYARGEDERIYSDDYLSEACSYTWTPRQIDYSVQVEKSGSVWLDGKCLAKGKDHNDDVRPLWTHYSTEFGHTFKVSKAVKNAIKDMDYWAGRVTRGYYKCTIRHEVMNHIIKLVPNSVSYKCSAETGAYKTTITNKGDVKLIDASGYRAVLLKGNKLIVVNYNDQAIYWKFTRGNSQIRRKVCSIGYVTPRTFTKFASRYLQSL